MLLRAGREVSRVVRAANPRNARPEARGQGGRCSPVRRMPPWTTPGSGAGGPPVAKLYSPQTPLWRSGPVTKRATPEGTADHPEDAAQAARARHCNGGRVGSVGSGSGSGPGLGGGSPGKGEGRGEGKGDGGWMGGMGCCEGTALHSPEFVEAEPSRRAVGARFDGPADAEHTTGCVVARRNLDRGRGRRGEWHTS